MKTRNFFVAMAAVGLLFTGCGNDCNEEKSVLFGDVPNVVRELIEKRIEIDHEIDHARAIADKDRHIYLEVKDQDLRDEYATRFLAEGKKVIGNKLWAEVYGVPFEIEEQPRIVEAVYDTSCTVSNGYKFVFDYKIRFTEDVKATYYDAEEKKWYYSMYYVLVGIDSNILTIGSTSVLVNETEVNNDTSRVMPIRSVTVMNDGTVVVGTREDDGLEAPMLKAGAVFEDNFSYGFRFRGDEAVLRMNRQDARLHKVIFLTNDEWRAAIQLSHKLWATEGKSKVVFEKSHEVRKGTDKPEYYDEPYVVSTMR